MTKRPIDRRRMLLTAGAAGIAACGPVAGQSSDIRGTVAFERGAVVPEGYLEIYLEDSAIEDDARRRLAETRVASNGGSKTIGFSLPYPARAAASPTWRIVARLERADGWLVARAG